MITCLHCNRSMRTLMAKGLCARCYKDSDICERYPKFSMKNLTIEERRAKYSRKTADDTVTVWRAPTYPTSALPGTRIKVMIMSMRVARSESPHHPLDARDQDEQCGISVRLFVEE